MAKINKKLQLALALSTLVGLAACSSTPSPWSQKNSPWDNQASKEVQETEQMDGVTTEVVEPDMNVEQGEMAAEGMTMTETAEMSEASPAMADAAEMPAEPEVPVEPEMTPVQQPAGMVVGGDLLSQPATYFTVQVCASSSMENLQSFARANNLSDQWTAQTSLNGKTWFILLTGVYQTKAEADASLASVQGLPTSPWVRTVGSVQAVAVH
ncbi:MAG: SPOR domain-containing protein [Gammaproteobacteria bacterium]|nr:SPOR domain-containing protein [Gammaproteobacteria bacterium]